MYEYRAILKRIVDADTIDCDVDMGFRAWRMGERFRLASINAYEMRGHERELGKAATNYLSGIIKPGDELVLVTEKDPDSFGRWIATVYYKGLNLNDDLVEKGHAVYKQY